MRTALTVEKNDSTKSSETRLDFMASLKEGNVILKKLTT